MSKLITFSQGPAINVTLKFEAGQFSEATLSFSKKFQCLLTGEAETLSLKPLLDFLESYGKKAPVPIKLPLDHLPPFRQKVLSRLQEVPFGDLLTYGELALAAGHPNAARAVGTTCRLNPFPLFIPCHRVIASGNRIGGFAYDIEMKRRLLDFESSRL